MSRRPEPTAKTDKPFGGLKRFARELGWIGLRRWRHSIEDDGRIIVWYIAGKAEGRRGDLFLQINEFPLGQTATYAAAVYAIRYGIVTGWHSMKLTPDGCCDDAEVQRLHGWLHRHWFDSLALRRQYRSLHPECAGWSWGRTRRDPLPHSPQNTDFRPDVRL